MLLKALYDLAQRQCLLDQVHLQSRDVHLLIPLDKSGTLVGDGLIPLTAKNAKGKDVPGAKKLLPRFPGENNGGKAYFLAESCVAILGIDKNDGAGIQVEEIQEDGRAKAPGNPGKAFKHFWQRVDEAFAATNLAELDALRKFRARYLPVEAGRVKPGIGFLEHRPNRTGKIEAGAKTKDGNWEKLASATLAFQVDGRPVFPGAPDEPIAQYWREIYMKEAFSSEDEAEQEGVTKRGVCMLTAELDVPIARSHKPKILRVPGLSSGGYVVSFAREARSFSSYGFDMGENAPVSERAASCYALALQSLLDDENTSLRIGPAVACFWAKDQPQHASFFAHMLSKPDPQAVAEFLKAPWAGTDRQLAKGDQFFSVTLTGNAGRVVVRHWMQQTVEQARENFRRWFADLDIAEIAKPSAGEGKKKRKKKQSGDGEGAEEHEGTPFSVFRLACATVREAKSLQPDVPGQLFRAALEGTAPSLMLIKPILHEFQSALVGDSAKKPRYPFSVSRFALLKLILIRNRKDGSPMIEPQVFETDDQAYNCGRLLSVLAEVQSKAHEFKLEGPGVAERYFGTASVSPSSVFPLLLRLNRHHLDKIGKSERFANHRKPLEDALQGIICRFKPAGESQPPQFPRTLDLQAQGRFAIGFYQQAADSANRRDEAIKAKAIQNQNKQA